MVENISANLIVLQCKVELATKLSSISQDRPRGRADMGEWEELEKAVLATPGASALLPVSLVAGSPRHWSPRRSTWRRRALERGGAHACPTPHARKW